MAYTTGTYFPALASAQAAVEFYLQMVRNQPFMVRQYRNKELTIYRATNGQLLSIIDQHLFSETHLMELQLNPSDFYLIDGYATVFHVTNWQHKLK